MNSDYLNQSIKSNDLERKIAEVSKKDAQNALIHRAKMNHLASMGKII